MYRGVALPELLGAYIFGDFGSGRIWSLTQDATGAWTRTELLDTTLNISSFGVDAAGEIYVLDIAGNAVHRLRRAP